MVGSPGRWPSPAGEKSSGRELHDTRAAIAAAKRSLVDLEDGSGEWRGTKVGDVARVRRETEQRRKRVEWRSNTTRGTEHRSAKRELRDLTSRLDQLDQRFEQLAAPDRDTLKATL